MALINQIEFSNEYVRENFTMSELRSNSSDAPDTWNLDDETLDLLQWIRTRTNQPIRVTSTLRTPTHNNQVGGVSDSRHLVGRAIDFQFINEQYHSDFINFIYEGFFEELSELGLGALGLYDTFFHIDNRDTDTYIFDNRSITPPGQPNIPPDFSEDGQLISFIDKIKKYKFWIIAILLSLLFLK